jgi:hypothetical protein
VAAVVGGVLNLFQESNFMVGIVTLHTQSLLYAQPALTSRKVNAKQSMYRPGLALRVPRC